ncbi:flagellar assembly protein FliH [Aneurinibacillus soli]|uniref:flagellar assembly protein FliH n=1 Tax=Aneurinibacillus soli TaxID=1500254 RepID=UPI0012FE1830|nr:flagellar assembly protein FliH [Aneurinibacillus soli]
MSRIIKSSFYSAVEDKRVIEAVVFPSSDPDPLEDADMTLEEDETARLHQERLRQAEEEAQSILEEARQQARKMMEEAQSEMDAWWEARRQEDEIVRGQASEEGFISGVEQGREQGRQEALEEYSHALAEARSILAEAPAWKRRKIGEAEPFVLELTLEIARKVIKEQFECDQEHLLTLIRRALSHTQEYKTITVAVNPDSYTYVQENRARLVDVLDSQVELTVVPDESAVDGGCIVRTSLGNIDARVDTQLAEIKKALLEIQAGESE